MVKLLTKVSHSKGLIPYISHARILKFLTFNICVSKTYHYESTSKGQNVIPFRKFLELSTITDIKNQILWKFEEIEYRCCGVILSKSIVSKVRGTGRFRVIPKIFVSLFGQVKRQSPIAKIFQMILELAGKARTGKTMEDSSNTPKSWSGKCMIL